MENQFIKLLTRNFIFCDVGAIGGIKEFWQSIRNSIDVVSFEPDQEEFKELLKKKINRDLVLPYVLSKEQ